MLLHEGGFDMFSLISDLHLSVMNITGADAAVEAVIAPLTETLSEMTGIDSHYYQERMDAYWEALEEKRAAQDSSEMTEAPAGGITGQVVNQELLDSLKTILEYSGCDDEFADSF